MYSHHVWSALCRAAVPPGCVSLLRGGRFQQLAVGGAAEPSEGGSSQPRVAPPPAARHSARRPLQLAPSVAPTAGGGGGGAAAGPIHHTRWRYVPLAPCWLSTNNPHFLNTQKKTWRQLCSYLASVLVTSFILLPDVNPRLPFPLL